MLVVNYLTTLLGLLIIFSLLSYMKDEELQKEFRLSFLELKIAFIIGNLLFLLGITGVALGVMEITVYKLIN